MYEAMVQSQIIKEGGGRKGKHRKQVAQQDTDGKGVKVQGDPHNRGNILSEAASFSTESALPPCVHLTEKWPRTHFHIHR